jgi:hypothetical protein
MEAFPMQGYGHSMNTKIKAPRPALGPVIVVTTSITLCYLTCILFGASLGWTPGLLLSAMVALLWMVVRILKDPYSTNKTFDEYIY